ncbi:MAG: hypothetical protein IT531_17180 [Burkholderiales bacterium]|nr:hypothetical protein [Burkholderiales bacterium]
MTGRGTRNFAAGLRSAGACLIAGVVASGCAQTPPAPQGGGGPPINLSGYSPQFRGGFMDGCDTARGSGRRDEKRYAEDAQYAQGWQDGRAICAKR